MQAVQFVFGAIGVVFMALGGLLMTRRSFWLNERFDAWAREHGCKSEHQACYEVALFCFEAAFLFVLVAFVATYVSELWAVSAAAAVLVVGLIAGVFSTHRRIDR